MARKVDPERRRVSGEEAGHMGQDEPYRRGFRLGPEGTGHCRGVKQGERHDQLCVLESDSCWRRGQMGGVEAESMRETSEGATADVQGGQTGGSA